MSIFLGSDQIDTINLIKIFDNELEDKLINRTLIFYNNSQISKFRSMAFAFCGSLTSVSFPNCTSIEEGVFYNCLSLTSVNFPNCSYIGNYVFQNCTNLTSVNIPNCSYIGEGAFFECSNLTSISFPKCVSIGSRAFAYCSKLNSISFPSCSYIGNRAFIRCGFSIVDFPNCNYIESSAFDTCAVQSINIPNCSYIGSYAFNTCFQLTNINCSSCVRIDNHAFSFCRALTSIDAPNCSYIGLFAFRECTALSMVNLPNCLSIMSNAFTSCTSLTTVNLLNCNYISSAAFNSCTALGSIDLPNCQTIEQSVFFRCTTLSVISFSQLSIIKANAFAYCYNLLSLYLLGSSIPSLANINAFQSTPISNYTTSTGGVYGSIYVPASLYSSYITTTNWSVYSARIVGVNIMTITYYNYEYSSDYFYEPSMTWADWVDSGYNTDGFYVYNNYFVRVNDSVDPEQWADLEGDNMGEEVSPNDRIVDWTDLPFHASVRLSKSGFNIFDKSEDNTEYFIYEIDMTWAEWIDSDYNTTNLVIDTATSYVGVWDDVNNTYVYLTTFSDSTYKALSTHKIVEDVDNNPNNDFQIDAVLTA